MAVPVRVDGLLFDMAAVLLLRSKYRLVGTNIGTLPTSLQQNETLGLPHLYMPEQMYLGVKQGWISLDAKSNMDTVDSSRCLVFEDLWHQGFYITDGSKFGGDFLVYNGDPIQYHARHIVIVVEDDPDRPARQLVAWSRLARASHKTVLLAHVQRDMQPSVTYTQLRSDHPAR